MPAAADYSATAFGDVLRAAMGDAENAVLAVDPSVEMLTELVDIAAADDDRPRIDVVARPAVLKTVTDDFVVASNAADLVAKERLDLRVGEETENSLLITDDAVRAVVRAGDRVGTLSTDEAPFVAGARDRHRESFDAAEQFELRTPPLSRIRETIAAEIGDGPLADFDAAVETLREADVDLDGVTVSLLVAARNEVLLYDISRWGEEIDLASKATFSRTKSRLEEVGIVDTEKVPIDVGRPRLRLMLADDRLRDASVGGLVREAAERLD